MKIHSAFKINKLNSHIYILSHCFVKVTYIIRYKFFSYISSGPILYIDRNK